MINLNTLSSIKIFGIGVSDSTIIEIEERLSLKLPSEYIKLLKQADGFFLDNGITVYSSKDICERNETFEVQDYAPGHLAIGDDSGGLSILINLENEKIFSVDQGSMDVDDMTLIGNSLSNWLLNGCKL
ncbi:SMI1/KNR4 family protein [Agarilytica rhodophyticola]|uniref:SMI1/KNR4 family protein n=1 Tax=Agarilytica rhodophyticola TaxID=1737490 RepID=UPI000B348A80|nr:SMI1/KNR4 family protein [Agarilytica rhodophyticola]